MSQLTIETILKLVCDHTGKRVSLNLEELDQHIEFARAVEQELSARRPDSGKVAEAIAEVVRQNSINKIYVSLREAIERLAQLAAPAADSAATEQAGAVQSFVVTESQINAALAEAESQPAKRSDSAAEPPGWREFLENLAKPHSEPLNSVCVYKARGDRNIKAGEIRNKARELLAAAPASADVGELPQDFISAVRGLAFAVAEDGIKAGSGSMQSVASDKVRVVVDAVLAQRGLLQDIHRAALQASSAALPKDATKAIKQGIVALEYRMCKDCIDVRCCQPESRSAVASLRAALSASAEKGGAA